MSTPANSLDITAAGLVKFDGTSTFSGVTVTNHGVLIGAASNGITSSAVGATNTVLNGNTGADPTFGTVPNGALANSSITLSNGTNITVTGSPVSLGGTATVAVSGPPSATTLTSHGVLVGAGASAITATAAGTSGQLLQSKGAAADPAYTTATYPSTGGTSGTILRSDGTNFVNSVAFKVDSTGRYSTNVQPGFSAYAHSGNANITGDGTLATIIFDTVSYNQGNSYDNTTGLFTVPITGIYLVTAQITVSGLSALYTTGEIQLNNQNGTTSRTLFNAGANLVSGSVVICLAACNTFAAGLAVGIQVKVSGSAKTVGIGLDSFGALSNFAMYQVG